MTFLFKAKVKSENSARLPMRSEMIQMAAMAVLARPMVDRNLSGWHMAYHRSTEMNVNVSTETDTETVCQESIDIDININLRTV